jgi:membrane-bound lytic murein transglycosylase D
MKYSYTEPCTGRLQSSTLQLLTLLFVVTATPFLSLLGTAFNAGATVTASSSSEFPRFPAIQSNVAFWEKIYTHYSTSEAVIHDQYDLSRIYAVIPIMDYLKPGAAKANKPLLDEAQEKYKAILISLAKGTPPFTQEERRIATIMKGLRQSQLVKASESVRVQIGQKERFREGVLRSRTHLPEIKKIFRSYNLPEELAYLPHVESSFNPDARSKVGASGLWQFTKSTGKEYLRIDGTIDERHDPILASHAAAKFLKRNHSVLGDWPLALTAYNYGTAGMARAKRDKGSYERIFQEYDEGYFKFASRNFYSEFLAALNSAKKLEQPLLSRPQTRPSVNTVRLSSQVSIDSIKRHFKVDGKTIKALNPTIEQSFLDGKKQLPKGYQLKLPATGQTSPEQLVSAELKKRPL